MDEQNKNTPKELHDEQMKDVTGGAFESGVYLGEYNVHIRWRCTYPAQTSQYESVSVGLDNFNPSKRCPYSTTPNKWCCYTDDDTCEIIQCAYFK